ncbi:hypothetical protein I6E36_05560 [Fusobacterium mortiferum]|uniref:hypothetical protein n=1 Tax=Fusobacterium mortiferum TaxID=850 RepID=UPI001F29A76A|nr:hypothetical protein [Fusobacterium mortiferum]MCF2627547.1 hypothetical protein [Fusobacterium mortiferum]
MGQENIGWNFPNSNHGKVSGISEAGIETFKGSLYSSLAREICQNSLDASLDNSKPVIVEFDLKEFNLKQDERISELENIFEKCREYWTDKKTLTFINKAIKVLQEEKIRVLRISDFNTTGLTGSDKIRNSCWQNLVKASGVSDKGGASGGSFGIGKSAPFACSDLRTIFYSTLDIDNIRAFQGVANIVSFYKDDNLPKEKRDWTQGTGYYGNIEDNSPIKEIQSFGNYIRKTSGTDIFVIGFMKDDSWKDEIVKAVLEGYLISILRENLVVKVDEIEISSKTLNLLIEKYKEDISLTYNYYQVLTSNIVPIEYNFEDLGKLSFYLDIKKDLKRSILMARSNGMKIFDKKGISSVIQFAGVCILEDEKINSYFREMETPQHNNWEPDRHSNPKEAKKKRTALYKYLKDTIFSKASETITDEVDAVGVGEFIPDSEDIDIKNSENTKEAISNEIKTISLEKVKTYKSTGNSSKKGNYFDEIDGFGTLTDDEILEGFQPQKNNSSTSSFNSKNSGGKSGEGNDVVNEKIIVNPLKMRLVASNSINKLNFVVDRDIDEAIIELKIAGEDRTTIPKIDEAFDNDRNLLIISENKVFLNNIKEKQNNSILFTLKEKENYCMEVLIYGNKK